MAKAKSNSSGSSKPAKKPGAKKSPAKKSQGGGEHQVDTTLAAQNAARHLMAGIGNKPAAAAMGTGSTGAKNESSMFKNLKQGLAKPHLSGLDGILDKSAPETKKSNTPFGSDKQVGRNQTFGADVNRTGVPRRTGG